MHVSKIDALAELQVRVIFVPVLKETTKAIKM